MNNDTVKVLLVSSDKYNLIAEQLQQAGFQVIQVEAKGSSIQEAIQDQPDVVMVDVDALQSRGEKLLIQVEGHPSRLIDRIPIIAAGSIEQSELMADWLKRGVIDYVIMPCHPELLARRIQLLLDREKPWKRSNLFISLLVHQINSAVAIVKSCVDILLGEVIGPINNDQRGLLTAASQAIHHVQQATSDWDLYRVEMPNLRYQNDHVLFAPIIHKAIENLKAQFEEKSQTLIVDVPQDLPAVWGNELRLFQLVQALIQNAYLYTPREGRITVKAQREDAAIHLSVQDTGIGIAPEEQANVFTLYWRSARPEVQMQPGTGLKLGLAEYIVEENGGRIWFESKLDNGTTFHVTLPIDD